VSTEVHLSLKRLQAFQAGSPSQASASPSLIRARSRVGAAEAQPPAALNRSSGPQLQG